MRLSLEKLDSSLFDWLKWLNGSPVDLFNVRCRSYDMIKNADVFRKAAVGYCEGEDTPCRPRPDHKAVMYFVRDEHFWFHMRNHEFRAIFGEESRESNYVRQQAAINSII